MDNLKQKSKVKMTSKWIDTYGDSALAKFLNTILPKILVTYQQYREQNYFTSSSLPSNLKPSLITSDTI